MRTKLHAIVAIAFTLLILPLSALAQDSTPEAMTFDLSTEAGLLAYQEAQADVTAEDVGLPEGFDLELVAGGLSFPDAVAVADDGTIFAALSGFGGTPGQVVVVNPDGTIEERSGRFFNVDLRAAMNFNFGENRRLSAYLDFYNLFNTENLAFSNRFGLDPATSLTGFLQPDSLYGPGFGPPVGRPFTLQIGARFSF